MTISHEKLKISDRHLAHLKIPLNDDLKKISITMMMRRYHPRPFNVPFVFLPFVSLNGSDGVRKGWGKPQITEIEI